MVPRSITLESGSNNVSIEKFIKPLKDKIKELERLVEDNKVFTYMVIHDLKHPTESLIA